MITIQCTECNHEFDIFKIYQLGVGGVTLFIEPCNCVVESDERMNELYNEIESLEGEVEVLEYSNSELNDMIEIVEKTSREVKWEAEVEKTQNLNEMLVIEINAVKEEIEDEKEERRKTIKTATEEIRQSQSNAKMKIDEAEMAHEELNMKYRKLVFEYDKMRSKINGNRYERSVDL